MEQKADIEEETVSEDVAPSIVYHSEYITESGIRFACAFVRNILYKTGGFFDTTHEDILVNMLSGVRKYMKICNFELIYGLRLMHDIYDITPRHVAFRNHCEVNVILIACLAVANKLQDMVYKLSSYSNVCRIELKLLNLYELFVLNQLKYNLIIPADVMQRVFELYDLFIKDTSQDKNK
jgi:hypothetical protein